MVELAVIIPSVKGLEAVPTLESALAQKGFSSLVVIVTGSSCARKDFRAACADLSPNLIPADPHPGKILPGRARNTGMDILKKHHQKADYILFLDDDILVPDDFALTLKQFLEDHPTVTAVMGRVESAPRTYWTRVIDYSNFWWLQVDKDIPDLGWLGAGATMTPFEKLDNLRFDEDLRVNEDTDFFHRLSQSSGGSLAVCAGTTCQHNHSRRRFREFVKYQFHNGINSRKHFHSRKVGVRSILIGIRNSLAFFKKTIIVNRGRLLKRPHLLLGISLAIIIYEYGIQRGIAQLKKEKI